MSAISSWAPAPCSAIESRRCCLNGDNGAPGYNYVLGMYAFGLEETGPVFARRGHWSPGIGDQSVDAWGVHAVTHVMEMQGRIREGIDFLTSREHDWADNNGLAFHNWWHLALFHLDAGNAAQVLDLFDRRIRPAPSQVPLEMVDASAMLWRLQLRGIDVGDRWKALASCWEPFVEHAYYAFNDVHAVMAFVGAGASDLAQRAIAAMEQKVPGLDTNAMMTRDVGLPLAQALVSFADGNYSDVVSRLQPIRTIANRFGGSHAQRDLIHLTLVESALRSDQFRLARALIAERTQLKPSSPSNWQLTARVMELGGDFGAAARSDGNRRNPSQSAVHAAAGDGLVGLMAGLVNRWVDRPISIRPVPGSEQLPLCSGSGAAPLSRSLLQA